MRLFRHLAAAALSLAGALALAPSAMAQEALSAEQKAAVRTEIRAYLLENPEILVEAFRILEDRRLQAEAEQQKNVFATLKGEIFDDGYSFVGGAPDGDVTMVEFIDYNCTFCKRAHPEVKKVLAEDPNIRYVVKEFPILGPTSEIAARAAMASMRQQDGALYLAYNDLMMRRRGTITEAQIFSSAEKVGLDVERLRADMEDPEIAARIERTYALARQLGVSGTPTFIIGESMRKGYIDAAEITQIVAEERALASN